MSDNEQSHLEVINSSLLKSLFFPLTWSCRLQIYSYLTISELKQYGLTCKTALVVFERERGARKCMKSKIDFSKFLKSGDVTYRENIPIPTQSVFGSNMNKNLVKSGRIVLVSYPRSGNSLIRTLLEKHSNIYTGSDNRPNRPLALNLLQMGGFYGEGIADDSVWIVKSHYPERVGYLPINTSVVVMIVRNPFDAISSYFQMGMTNSHNKTLTEESMRILRTVWDDFIKNEVSIWNRFHEYWLEVCESVCGEGNIPVYMVRYEDLLHDQENTMRNLMTFLAPYYPTRLRANSRSSSSKSSSSVSNTRTETCGFHTSKSLLSVYSSMSLSPNEHSFDVCVQPQKGQKELSKKEQKELSEKEQYQKDKILKEKSQNVIVTDMKSSGYVPRQGGIGKSLSHMTSKQVLFIQKSCQQLLWKFGYNINTTKHSTKSKSDITTGFNGHPIPPAVPMTLSADKNKKKSKQKLKEELKEERLLEIAESKNNKNNKKNKNKKSDTFLEEEMKVKLKSVDMHTTSTSISTSGMAGEIALESTVEMNKQYYTIAAVESTYITNKNDLLLNLALSNISTSNNIINHNNQHQNIIINPMTKEELHTNTINTSIKLIKSLSSGIRLDSDIYGRNINDLRYMYTDNDQIPLDIVNK